MKKYVIRWILYVLKLISALHQHFAIEISKRLASHFILSVLFQTTQVLTFYNFCMSRQKEVSH